METLVEKFLKESDRWAMVFFHIDYTYNEKFKKDGKFDLFYERRKKRLEEKIQEDFIKMAEDLAAKYAEENQSEKRVYGTTSRPNTKIYEIKFADDGTVTIESRVSLESSCYSVSDSTARRWLKDTDISEVLPEDYTLDSVRIQGSQSSTDTSRMQQFLHNRAMGRF